MNISKIKMILFDLGNVVIDLNEQSSYDEMSNLSAKSFDELNERFKRATFFNDLERGHISDKEFRNQIRELLANQDASDYQIDEAWNAMLLSIDLALIEQLIKLKNHVKIMVLSNTNIIHERAFHQTLLKTTGHKHLNEIFDKVYLSHEIGERKPDKEAWEVIIKENEGISAKDILFLDDKLENLESAKSIGINTMHIKKPVDTLNFIQSIK